MATAAKEVSSNIRFNARVPSGTINRDLTNVLLSAMREAGIANDQDLLNMAENYCRFFSPDATPSDIMVTAKHFMQELMKEEIDYRTLIAGLDMLGVTTLNISFTLPQGV